MTTLHDGGGVDIAGLVSDKIHEKSASVVTQDNRLSQEK